MSYKFRKVPLFKMRLNISFLYILVYLSSFVNSLLTNTGWQRDCLGKSKQITSYPLPRGVALP